MRYYVLYEFYHEYTQFEGSWGKDWIGFDTVGKAEDFIKGIKPGSDYRNIIGPLFLMKLGDV